MNRNILLYALLIASGLIRELSIGVKFGLSSETNELYNLLPLGTLLSEIVIVLLAHTVAVPFYFSRLSSLRKKLGAAIAVAVLGFFVILIIVGVFSLFASTAFVQSIFLFSNALSLFLVSLCSVSLPFVLLKPSLYSVPFIFYNLFQAAFFIVMLPLSGTHNILLLFGLTGLSSASLSVYACHLWFIRHRQFPSNRRIIFSINNMISKLLSNACASKLRSLLYLFSAFSSPVFLLLMMQYLLRICFGEGVRTSATLNYSFRLSEIPVTFFVATILPQVYILMSHNNSSSAGIFSVAGFANMFKALKFAYFLAPFVLGFFAYLQHSSPFYYSSTFSFQMIRLFGDHQHLLIIALDAIAFLLNLPAQIMLYTYSRYFYVQKKAYIVSLSFLLLAPFLLFVYSSRVTINSSSFAAPHLVNLAAYYFILLVISFSVPTRHQPAYLLPKTIHAVCLIALSTFSILCLLR